MLHSWAGAHIADTQLALLVYVRQLADRLREYGVRAAAVDVGELDQNCRCHHNANRFHYVTFAELLPRTTSCGCGACLSCGTAWEQLSSVYRASCGRFKGSWQLAERRKQPNQQQRSTACAGDLRASRHIVHMCFKYNMCQTVQS